MREATDATELARVMRTDAEARKTQASKKGGNKYGGWKENLNFCYYARLAGAAWNALSKTPY